MDKIQALQTLKETVEKEEIKLKMNYYAGENGCYCVIGHLLLQGGVTKEQLKRLDSENDSPYNGNYSMRQIIDYIDNGRIDEREDFVGKALKGLGFDVNSWDDKMLLYQLQRKNDLSKGNQKEEVICFLDVAIQKLKS